MQEIYSVFFCLKKKTILQIKHGLGHHNLHAIFPLFQQLSYQDQSRKSFATLCCNIVDIGQKNTLIIGVLTLRRQMEGYCILEKVRGEGWRFLGLQNRVHFILGLASENGSFLKHQCNLSALRLSA